MSKLSDDVHEAFAECVKLRRELAQANAALTRVRALPEQWRKSTDYSYYGDSRAQLRDDGRESCADELESAINGEGGG